MNLLAVSKRSKLFSQNEGKSSCCRLSRRGSKGRCRICRHIARVSLLAEERDQAVRRRVVHGPSVGRKEVPEVLDIRDHIKA